MDGQFNDKLILPVLWHYSLLVIFFLSVTAISRVSKTFINLSLIVGFASVALTNAASTLMIDLVPDQSSSVTACVGEPTYELKKC